MAGEAAMIQLNIYSDTSLYSIQKLYREKEYRQVQDGLIDCNPSINQYK